MINHVISDIYRKRTGILHTDLEVSLQPKANVPNGPRGHSVYIHNLRIYR